MKNQWNIKQEPKGSSIGCVDLSIVSKNYYNIVPLTKVIARKIWERGNIVNKTKYDTLGNIFAVSLCFLF